MLSRDIIPDVITYTALICAFCKNGKVSEADELVYEMLTDQVAAHNIFRQKKYRPMLIVFTFHMCMHQSVNDTRIHLILMRTQPCLYRSCIPTPGRWGLWSRQKYFPPEY